MKTKLLIIGVVAILASACTTESHMARTYDDDIYFSPGDVPPVTMAPQQSLAKVSNSDAKNNGVVISQMHKNADGTTTLNNDIYQPDDANKNAGYQAYDNNQQDLAGSDTTAYYNDDSVKYVINNYYQDNNDMDFSNRINRFYSPYSYDPFFYNDWNSGFYTGFYGGYDPWFSRGWGSPYGFGYYSPFAMGFGLGGLYGGGYGSYYDGYYGGGYGGYYGGGYGGGYYGQGGGFSNNHEVARRRSTEMNMPARENQDNTAKSGSPVSGSRRDGNFGNTSDSKLPTGINSRSQIGNTRNGSTVDASGNSVDIKNGTIVNNRRGAGTSGSQVQSGNTLRSQAVRPNTNSSGNIRRSYQPSTSVRTYGQSRVVNQGQNYTPSYNKPRIVNQSNYNNNSYTRPRTSGGTYERGSIRSANTSNGQSYSAPRSSSNMKQSYRSSPTYSNGSSSSNRSSGSGYSSPSNSGSGGSYSAPSRSSSSGGGGSYSGGSSSGGGGRSSSSGSSSGGSSGGGGGSGSRR